jgi:hypothetical protein
MTGDKGWLSSLVPVVTRRYITFGDNGRGRVLSEGEIKVSDKITLRRVIIGMDWLGECDGIIMCAKKAVLLTSPQGDRIEVTTTAPSKKEGKVNQDEGK